MPRIKKETEQEKAIKAYKKEFYKRIKPIYNKYIIGCRIGKYGKIIKFN